MCDFDNVFLTFSEKLTLLRFVFRKRIPKESLHRSADVLISYGLIHRNYSDKENEIGNLIPDGTYSPTNLCRRYFVYLCTQLKRSVLYPIMVAFVTTLITNAAIK